ncbi:MAG: thymidine phosphorylase [bacterium]
MRTVYEILAGKRDGQKLPATEIEYLVREFTAGRLPDYQMAAFLMAAFINGLDTAETACLTKAMLESGEKIMPAKLDRSLIDKHSTGGVGDKLSLILSPLLAECGIAVGMISGRGLGHTGGTLDKLEAIPGMQVFHSRARFNSLLKRHHFAITGQTAKIAPADRKIYALRDVTGTVESIQLIVASIMSKKLALKTDGIVFDIKAGNGAFMKSTRDAAKLAESLLAVARAAKLPARAIISDMNQPTGRMIGNWLEVEETIETLQGKGPADTRALTLELAAQMLLAAGVERDLQTAKAGAAKVLDSGAALESFLRYVKACGGETASLERPAERRRRIPKLVVLAKRSGYVVEIESARLGYLATALGAGRQKSDDLIDPLAGIELLVKRGERIGKGQPLAVLYTQKRARLAAAGEACENCLRIGSGKPAAIRLILRRIGDG